eukprot:scaffold647989_cov48-Prasinocladus_malaysianus.AAC.1
MGTCTSTATGRLGRSCSFGTRTASLATSATGRAMKSPRCRLDSRLCRGKTHEQNFAELLAACLLVPSYRPNR